MSNRAIFGAGFHKLERLPGLLARDLHKRHGLPVLPCRQVEQRLGRDQCECLSAVCGRIVVCGRRREHGFRLHPLCGRNLVGCAERHHRRCLYRMRSWFRQCSDRSR
jgi:hypothetical protein